MTVELPPSLSPPSASAMRTLLVMTVVVGGLETVTANSRTSPPPGGMSGTAMVQTVPAGLPPGHDQPGELAAASKLVDCGTVSVIVTPVAVLPPLLP